MQLRRTHAALFLVAAVVGSMLCSPAIAKSHVSQPVWDLKYPIAISYRLLSQSTAIKCNQTDATFQSQVVAAHLDSYQAVVTHGARSDCGRLKAEQFKRLYPDKMVIAYANANGNDPKTWPGGTWPGYYLLMNRSVATGAVNSTQTTIAVADAQRFATGDIAVMWNPSPSDPFAKGEWVRVDGVSGSTLTVTRNLFATGAMSYATPPFLAAAPVGPSSPNPQFNLSDMAPVNPANGLRGWQWLADALATDFAPNASAPSLDGFEFDVASWAPPATNVNGAIKNLDCDGDGIIDYCQRAVGTPLQVNSYGVGYDSFIRRVSTRLKAYDTDPLRPAKMVLGDAPFHSLDAANGAEFESFPSWDNYDKSSSALADLDFWQSQDTSTGSHFSYAFTKDATPLYPRVSDQNPNGCVTPPQGGTCRNGTYRYGMAAALVTGSGSTYNDEADFGSPLPWDEEATINQATTGLAPGYLGRPVGPATRITRYTSSDLVTNGSYEVDLSAVTTSSVTNGVRLVRDTATAAPGNGTASLRADVSVLTPNPQLNETKATQAMSSTPVFGKEYTVEFWAKGDTTASGPQVVELGVGMTNASGSQTVKVGGAWTHYVLSVRADVAGTGKGFVKFNFGGQPGRYWVDGVQIHQGTAGIITREYTNGIVVLNDSSSDQANIPLTGGLYRRINGVQDRSVNDGTTVGTTLPSLRAKDGIILRRS